MASPQKIRTGATDLLGIKHPVLLAGMNKTASPKLAAAVTNAGGLGVIGGGMYTPQLLRESIAELKSYLVDKNAPFGVDLLIPKVGNGARATNYDYNKGRIMDLIDVIVEGGAKLFVCAVGIPSQAVVDRLHAGGVLYMNMIGHPKHAQRAIDLGADLLCAAGGEAGGHTGDVPTVILIPAVKKIIKGQISKFTDKEIQLVGGGGMHNGHSLAGAMMLGAQAIWVGTRFILCEESGSGAEHQEAVRSADHGQIVRTTIFSGRPMHVRSTPYIERWISKRQDEMQALQAKGIIPLQNDFDKFPDDAELTENAFPMIMGKVAAEVKERKRAKTIVDEMVEEAAELLAEGAQTLDSGNKSKL
ncbi:2-nitropropane dioxygenase [Eremomyces bilateralis CBS 781.70]|uniref:2-nitropropane dioxygenase n=1 Tax=Eremomyces bilateralis CBS 781.70 TaxID=1392243 RepID=A0A6G1G3X6_9PEZI|nr:2-nitropropane dioxygenase [Eremomyces bilateralis CBS 781.70]KAF1812763.1 2-nitropropane dioxygenase [Eremomyces bilateralis CBS 781.70]